MRDLDGPTTAPAPCCSAAISAASRTGRARTGCSDRLEAIGLRPISALVDITNFVTFDLNRPLHVFDAGKLAGDLTMRLRAAGRDASWRSTARNYALDPRDHGDRRRRPAVQGLGGIMGGEATGCTEATDRGVHRGGAVRSDPHRRHRPQARHRERRALPLRARPRSGLRRDWGAEVATRLILELCGGEASEIVIAGAMPEWRRSYALRPARIGGARRARRAGRARARAILDSLGFESAEAASDAGRSTPPSWRADIEGEADLVEEVLRIQGFDQIPAVPLPRESALPRAGDRRRRSAAPTACAARLAARGLIEAVTFSFMPRGAGRAASAAPGRTLRLVNPISADLDAMRPSILPRPVDGGARATQTAGLPIRRCSRSGRTTATTRRRARRLVAAGLRAGRTRPRHWREPARDGRSLRRQGRCAGRARGRRRAGRQRCRRRRRRAALVSPRPRRRAAPRPDGAGAFRRAPPGVLDALDLEGRRSPAFEVFLDARAAAARARRARAPLSLRRSSRSSATSPLSSIATCRREAAARRPGADKELITDGRLFDVYEGDGPRRGQEIARHLGHPAAAERP